MPEATYLNYKHYIQEGWLKQPKQFFIELAEYIKGNNSFSSGETLLDIGCATGELIYFLATVFPDIRYTGVDVFDELISESKIKQPEQVFAKESVLALPDRMSKSFSLVTAMGVMSIFDEKDLKLFWDNLFKVTKIGGWIYVLSPLNEYGVDTLIQHRKRLNNQKLHWEKGWNVYSFETIEDILSEYQCEHSFSKFQINKEISPKEDPVRTWTMSTDKNRLQLMNGLKLLVDHYFIKVKKTGE